MTIFRNRSVEFYACRNVLVIFLISAYMSGIVIYGFTAFIAPLSEEFHWSYAQISFAASIRGLETGIFSPVIGFMTDRFGSKKLILLGVLSAGLGLLLFNLVNALWMLYGIFILLSLGTSTAIGVVPQTLASHWFTKRLPLAISIVVCGTAAGGLTVPLLTRMIELFNLQTALTILGIGGLIILIPLTFLVRDKPEINTINKKELNYKELSLVKNTTENVTTSKAIKSRAFWLISLGIMCHVLVVNAVLVHIMPYLSNINVVQSTSSMVVSAIAVSGIVGRLSFGWLGSKFDKRRLLALGLFMTGISMILFNYIPLTGTWMVIPFIFLFGIGFGGPVPIIAPLVKEHFGIVNLGTILGLVMGIITLGNLIGPPVTGWFFDNFGKYNDLWLFYALILILGMFALLSIPKAKLNTGQEPSLSI